MYGAVHMYVGLSRVLCGVPHGVHPLRSHDALVKVGGHNVLLGAYFSRHEVSDALVEVLAHLAGQPLYAVMQLLLVDTRKTIFIFIHIRQGS